MSRSPSRKAILSREPSDERHSMSTRSAIRREAEHMFSSAVGLQAVLHGLDGASTNGSEDLAAAVPLGLAAVHAPAPDHADAAVPDDHTRRQLFPGAGVSAGAGEAPRQLGGDRPSDKAAEAERGAASRARLLDADIPAPLVTLAGEIYLLGARLICWDTVLLSRMRGVLLARETWMFLFALVLVLLAVKQDGAAPRVVPGEAGQCTCAPPPPAAPVPNLDDVLRHMAGSKKDAKMKDIDEQLWNNLVDRIHRRDFGNFVNVSLVQLLEEKLDEKSKQLNQSIQSLNNTIEARAHEVLLPGDLPPQYDEAVRALMNATIQNYRDELKRFDKTMMQQVNAVVSHVSSAVAQLSDAHGDHNHSLALLLKQVVNFTDMEQVRRAIRDFAADKVNMADYALADQGAKIISAQYTAVRYLQPLWNILRTDQSPKAMLKSTMEPTSCFLFAGGRADVLIHLPVAIEPRSFSIEHLPHSLLLDPELGSAPKLIGVTGYADLHYAPQNDKQVFQQNVTFDYGPDQALQTFSVAAPSTSSSKTINAVLFQVFSNHGNPSFTCVYRFRVHGVPHTPPHPHVSP